MVEFDQGINKYRDLINTENNKIQLGSDGTAKTTTDIDINSFITGTEFVNSNTVFCRGVKISYATTTGAGSGSSAREYVRFNSAGLALGGGSFPAIPIDASTEIEVDDQIILLQELE